MQGYLCKRFIALPPGREDALRPASAPPNLANSERHVLVLRSTSPCVRRTASTPTETTRRVTSVDIGTVRRAHGACSGPAAVPPYQRRRGQLLGVRNVGVHRLIEVREHAAHC